MARFPKMLVPMLAVGMVAYREGFSPEPTDLVDGYSTVGYGHLIALRPVTAEDRRGIWVEGQQVPGRLTKKEARTLLRKDLRAAARAVRKYVKVPLNRRQLSALISFTFNCGAGALAESTLLRELNQGCYSCVPRNLMMWVNGPNGPLPGLVKRRRAEGKRFRPLHDPTKKRK